MTKPAGQHVAQLSQFYGDNVQPPPHWLAMVQEQAPQLLEPDKPLSAGFPVGAINPSESSTASPKKSDLGLLRRSLFWLGEWLLRFGHILTDGQQRNSESPSTSSAPPTSSEESRKGRKESRENSAHLGNSNQPPDHWLAMVQGRAPHLLNPSKPLTRACSSEPKALSDERKATADTAMLNSPPLQDSDLSFRLTNSGLTSGLTDGGLINSKSVQSVYSSLRRINAVVGKVSDKFSQWLSPLDHVFTDVPDTITYSDTLENDLAKRCFSQEAEPDNSGFKNSGLMSDPERRFNNASRQNVHSDSSGIRTKTRANRGLDSLTFSDGFAGTADMNVSLVNSIRQLNTAKFSWPLVRFGKWLLSLGWALSVKNADIFSNAPCNSSHYKSVDRVDTDYRHRHDTSSVVSPSVSPGQSDPYKANASWFWKVKFSKWLSSLGRIFVAKQHLITQLGRYVGSYESPISRKSRYQTQTNARSKTSSVDVESTDLGELPKAPLLSSVEASFSKPLTKLSQWLLSLCHTLTIKQHDPAPAHSHSHSHSQQQHIEQASDQFSHDERNIVAGSLQKNVDSLSDIYNSQAVQFGSRSGSSQAKMPSDNASRPSSYASNVQRMSDSEELQAAVWPILHDEDNFEKAPGEVRNSIEIKRMAIEKKAKGSTEDFTWPELLSNSARDGLNSFTILEKSDVFMAKESKNLTKVIDTMKERKQRELTGALWNA